MKATSSFNGDMYHTSTGEIVSYKGHEFTKDDIILDVIFHGATFTQVPYRCFFASPPHLPLLLRAKSNAAL